MMAGDDGHSVQPEICRCFVVGCC